MNANIIRLEHARYAVMLSLAGIDGAYMHHSSFNEHVAHLVNATTAYQMEMQYDDEAGDGNSFDYHVGLLLLFYSK